jgi:hypothetical protein
MAILEPPAGHFAVRKSSSFLKKGWPPANQKTSIIPSDADFDSLLTRARHCERHAERAFAQREAIYLSFGKARKKDGLLRRCAPRNDNAGRSRPMTLGLTCCDSWRRRLLKSKAWMAVGGPAVSSTAMTGSADGSLNPPLTCLHTWK